MNGWYYLQTDEGLYFQPDGEGCEVADLRDSPIVRMFWPVSRDRVQCWRMLVEAEALSPDNERVAELAQKWGCDDKDCERYAKHIGVSLGEDGNQKQASLPAFVNVQESPVGFGDTNLKAMAELCRQIWTPRKMWGESFAEAVKRASAARGPSPAPKSAG